MIPQCHPRFGAVLLFWGVVFPSILRAQTFTGTVVGHVVDPLQRVVGSASVTLRSAEREFERFTTTNANGEFAFQLVPPGKFTVRAVASGFEVATVRVEVVVATPVRVDVSLQVKSPRQLIQVFGESGVSVQTENAGLGFTISPREMSDLPSRTRSSYDFIALMPGANPSNDDLGAGFAVNGGRTQSANYLLDGGENNKTFMSVAAQNVPLDSIEEFSVQTNHYSAEYGRNAGFIANIVTKAGTRDFHGSLYDYVRNSALAANTFDNNANDLPRPVFNRHQFGGTLGGPLRPAKLFFFASMEPILVRSAGPNKYYVPTPQLLAISAPGTRAIFRGYPPPGSLSTTDVFEKKVCPFGASCNTETGAGLVTLPAFAATARLGSQDAGAGAPQNTILATGRMDRIINSETQAFVRYALEDFDEFGKVSQPYSSSLDSPYFGRRQSLALNLIHVASPYLATESRFVYSRFRGENQTVPQPALPQFHIRNEPDVVLPSGTPLSGGPENFYQFFQTVIWSRDRHTVKFGGQFVHLRESISLGNGVGEFADAPFKDVQGFVDGTLESYRIAVDPKGHYPGEFIDPPFGPPSFTRHYRYNDAALFVADTWKITPRFVLTPGLRWEYFGVLHSPGVEHTLDSNFYPGSGSNVLERIATGRFLRTVDAPGNLHGRFYLPDYRDFAPRLGIAYDLFGDGKTVIRAGSGVFYDRRVGWELFRAFLNPPGYNLTRLAGVRATADMLVDQYAVFPNEPVQLSQSVTPAIDTNLRTAYTLSWNATIEHELAGSMVLGASYLGSSANQLYSINNVSRFGSRGLLEPGCIGTRIAGDGRTSIGPDYKKCPGLLNNIAALTMRTNGGHSSFEALQLRLDSRRLLRWGAEFGVNYAWSHSIDNRSVSGLSDSIAETGGGFLDAYAPGFDRGSSDFDVRHRIAAHWIWEIPLGRGLQDRKRRLLLGGWEISGLLSYQTGQPFSIADSGVPDRFDERTRPRLTGTAPVAGPLVPDAASPNSFLYVPLTQVYDSGGACIANAAPFACEISVNGPFDGTLPRNTYRAPGTFYQNTALLKNIPLPREGMKLQFRAEFYNLFNHPNLYVNGPNAFSSSTTDVNVASFAASPSQARVPGVTISFKDNRQIVLALRFTF